MFVPSALAPLFTGCNRSYFLSLIPTPLCLLYAEFVLTKGGWLTVTYTRNFCLPISYLLPLNCSTVRFLKLPFICSQGHNSKQRQGEKGISVHFSLLWIVQFGGACVWQEWTQGLKMSVLGPLHLHYMQFAPLLQSRVSLVLQMNAPRH